MKGGKQALDHEPFFFRSNILFHSSCAFFLIEDNKEGKQYCCIFLELPKAMKEDISWLDDELPYAYNRDDNYNHPI